MMKSEVLHEFGAMIEADAELRPSPGEFEMAYQARVAIDRIRFAIKATESTREHPDELKEAAMQLLDAARPAGGSRAPFSKSLEKPGPALEHSAKYSKWAFKPIAQAPIVKSGLLSQTARQKYRPNALQL